MDGYAAGNAYTNPNAGGGYAGAAPPFNRPAVAQRGMLSMWFFAAGMIVLTSGLLGFLDILFQEVYAIFDLTETVYLAVFGLIVMLVDVPLNIRGITQAKKAVSRYCRYLTRLAGKGSFLIFLATNVYGTLMDNNISPFLGIVLGAFVFCIGCTACFFSFTISKKLERGRLALQRQFDATALNEKVFQHYARKSQRGGMNSTEFAACVMHFTGEQLLDSDVAAIFDALCYDVNSRELSSREFSEWVQAGRVWV